MAPRMAKTYLLPLLYMLAFMKEKGFTNPNVSTAFSLVPLIEKDADLLSTFRVMKLVYMEWLRELL